MSVVRTVKELSTDPEFAGYYDLEEKHRQQIADAKETGMDEATHSIAKKLLQFGTIPIEQIAEATGLSIEEIEKLKEEN